MNLTLSSDNYTQEFEITDINEHVLTFADPDDLAEDLANLDWVIRGAMKNQRVHLSSITIRFGNAGERGSIYAGKADRGENTT
jgi:hypothetical protein